MKNSTSDDELFGDDENNPISFVHRYDTVVTFDGGGAYLGIVIAAPLLSDHRSIARLKEKLRFYLESFFSPFGQQTWQTPREGKMKIYIKIHHDSCPEAFAIMQNFKDVAARRGVELVISITG